MKLHVITPEERRRRDVAEFVKGAIVLGFAVLVFLTWAAGWAPR
jgi:hypothetical protein